MQISGAAAVVFGGASGLGEATVRRLADLGGRVLIADLNYSRAADLAEEVGGLASACDITDPASVGDVIDKATALSPHGLRISIVCAGLATPAKLIGPDGATPLEAFTSVIQVNLVGTINALRVAAAAMVTNAATADNERGVCINTASIAAYEGQIGQIAYAASKGGVVGLTLPAARELAKKGVRVVTIAPGLFSTPMLAGLPQTTREALADVTPFPARLGDPSEYAHLVEHIITNTMLNGEVIRLDGGLRLAPR